MLALDLDGTLLRGDGEVDPRDRDAIAEVRRAGVHVTIVTGRLHSGAIGAARACEIVGPIACVEGSHLVEAASGVTLARRGIEGATATRLREVLAGHGLATFLFEADGIHHDVAGEPFAHYVATWSPNLRVVEDVQLAPAWQAGPLATVTIGEAGAVAAAAAAAREVGGLFVVTFAVSACPGKHAVLTRAFGPTKGSALAELCARYGCGLGDVVAVGDWLNDVPMFEVAGRSFVMGEAPEAVRAAASDQLLTPAGAGGGVAEAIARAWG
jgi:hydroxymethylpyrimidine pyrophosphatase-like HAD family hydrolase